MPRTKVSKNAKRNRANPIEEMIANNLRDYECRTDDLLVRLDNILISQLETISVDINMQKQGIPNNVLNMTLGELRSIAASTFLDINSTLSSTNSDANITQANATYMATRKQSKEDEGYLTEGSNQSGTKCSRNVSGLEKHTNRRSKSADLVSHTPLGKSAHKILLTNQKNRMMTPLSNSHSSRPKFRTPMTNRVKAASADRVGVITPKITFNEPIAMLRYANIGETVVSMSGSPVIVSSQSTDNKANVNIPVRDGIISLRATELKNFDQHLISKIDPDTLNHLRTLQKSLSLITSMADNQKILRN